MGFAAHDNLALIHAIFACILTLFVVPGAMLVARFRCFPKGTVSSGSTSTTTLFGISLANRTWFHLHVSLNALGLILIVAVFVLGVMAVQTQDEGYQFSGPNSDTHHKLGLAAFLLFVCQAGLGWWAHRVPSGRGSSPSTLRKSAELTVKKEVEGERSRENRGLEANLLPSSVTNSQPKDRNSSDAIEPAQPVSLASDGSRKRCRCSSDDPLSDGVCKCAPSYEEGKECTCGAAQVEQAPEQDQQEDPENGPEEQERSEYFALDRENDPRNRTPLDNASPIHPRSRQSKIRWAHRAFGVLVAAVLYATAWNGLNVEWASMSTSETVTPQAVLYLFWIFFLAAVATYGVSLAYAGLEQLNSFLQSAIDQESKRLERRTGKETGEASVRLLNDSDRKS